MKSLQWQQKVGCLKNLGMNLWSFTCKPLLVNNGQCSVDIFATRCKKKYISTNSELRNMKQLLEKSILKNIRINIVYQLTRKVKEESTNRTSLMFFFLSAPFLALSLEMSTTPSPSPSTSAVWVILPSYSLPLSFTQPSWKGER